MKAFRIIRSVLLSAVMLGGSLAGCAQAPAWVSAAWVPSPVPSIPWMP